VRSNINLSADKGQVLREAFRVLKPGGRFAVSDVVVQGELPAAIRTSLEQWVGCVAGALEEDTYRRLLADAGFVEVGVEVTRVYDAREAGAVEAEAEAFAAVQATGGRLVSAFVRALRPSGGVRVLDSDGAASVPIVDAAYATASAACCSAEDKTSCCTPEEKSSCCGGSTGAAPSSCGCTKR
jgi:hypothetical protein